ncbi:MAG: ThuA domain-containing protein [Oscillospiraceae bacterium]|nr:ThuA domain-containing protein [Oscillospiraceae bacterium]
MNKKNKKILVTGDYAGAQWHPLKGVDERLEKILAGYDLDFSENYPGLTPEELNNYGVLICYIDAWNKRGARKAAGAILSYVAGGGSLLSLHSGIIMSSTPEMELMQGGRFTGHPEACELTYSPVSPVNSEHKHPVLEGIEAFTIFEEPYRIDLCAFAEHEKLLTYSHDGRDDWPAGWTLPYGMGRIVYLSPGHQASSFDNKTFAGLILNSIRWLSGSGS